MDTEPMSHDSQKNTIHHIENIVNKFNHNIQLTDTETEVFDSCAKYISDKYNNNE